MSSFLQGEHTKSARSKGRATNGREGRDNDVGRWDDFLTVDELCELLKIGYNAAYTLLNSRTIKSFRNGRVWRIPKQAVIDYICKL